MKTLINRSFLILMFIAVFSGCELNSVESPDTTATIEGVSTETIAREIGRQHNAGLDFILQRMKQRKDPFADREDALKFFRESAEDYIQTEADVNRGMIAENFNMERIFDRPETGREKPIDRLENPTLNLDSEKIALFKNMLNVYQQKRDYDFFEGDYTPALNDVYRDLVPSLSPEERLLVQSVRETLAASFQYWEENRSEWIAEVARLHKDIGPADATALQSDLAVATPCIAVPSIPLCYAINWDEVIQADGGGLIEGVVGNVLYWIVAGPPGWVKGGAILAGGAAAASSSELYDQIMDLI